jgi:ribonucleoside-diphosphate reductase alpha chain
MAALKELQNYTFVSKYARWIEEKHRRETWKEAVDRVRQMMHRKYANKNIGDTIDWAYDMMEKKKVLGSQRALQYGGKPIEKTNWRIFNCVGSYCDRARFFQECFWLLLCGCGTGFSIQNHHVENLPLLSKRPLKPLKKIFKPEDTIEGWADCLGALLSSYFNIPTEDRFDFINAEIEFDFSNIRPKGSYLSSGIGKAPGPEPLSNALENIRKLLNTNQNNKLSPLNCLDIIAHSSDAVLSGGVRRSSCLALFSIDNLEMITAKTGNWRQTNPQRARINNSALLLRGKTKYEDFAQCIEYTKEYGEPGFIWGDNTEFILNPCGEVSMYPVDIETNKTGWQACNLSTINCGSIKDEEDFYERCKAAAIIGTLQAGFTDCKYLGETSKKICDKEALIGVSMTGTMENFEIVLNPKIQTNGSDIVKKTNLTIASQININQAARTTVLKPEGTTSCLLGTSSGIHPHHAKRYLRRVQNNNTEIPFQFFKKFNPQATEKSVWCANNTDENIIFPIEVPDGAKTKNQLPAIDMLKIVKSSQEYWISNGRNQHLCVKPWLNHNVSNTIMVMPHEWDEVTRFIFDNCKDFTGISLISASGDKDYPQTPFTAIYTSREIVKEYGDASIWCSGLIEFALDAFDNNLWTACDALLQGYESYEHEKVINIDNIKIIKLKKTSINDLDKQLNWISKSTKYANKYFNGDIKKLTYCLKDVYNWKLYSDLKDSFVSIDYTEMLENEDNTKPEQELSCVNGACALI